MAVADITGDDVNDASFWRDAERRQAVFREQRQRLQETRKSMRQDREESGSRDISIEGNGHAEHVSIFSYSAMLVAACFKDILDFSFILAIPGIGTVITLCFDILIFFFLIFPKRRYRLMTNTKLVVMDTFILLGLIPIEGLAFPFNLFPFTIAAVYMIYLSDKKFVEARNSIRAKRKPEGKFEA